MPADTIKVKVAVPTALVDEVPVTVRTYVPGVVGVPEIRPVVVLKLIPAGAESQEAE